MNEVTRQHKIFAGRLGRGLTKRKITARVKGEADALRTKDDCISVFTNADSLTEIAVKELADSIKRDAISKAKQLIWAKDISQKEKRAEEKQLLQSIGVVS